jgi:two-component system response regulator
VSIRILLAEDNRADVMLIREALAVHRVEHELVVAGDGEVALRLVAHMGEPGEMACPDLLLLDLNLPRADGIEILRNFRQHPQCALTPVIVVSSSDMPRERESAAALGISRYFRKPADLQGFLEIGALIKDVLATDR